MDETVCHGQVILFAACAELGVSCIHVQQRCLGMCLCVFPHPPSTQSARAMHEMRATDGVVYVVPFV